ncbi:regulator [Streptomyces sp. NPDC000961]|uniref:regulator n=1 Tax=Streptomyces TaxID=1883 RepID=UPI0036930A0F
MTSAPRPCEFERTCSALASPELIRLITEIDDNGTVPPRGLARTLPDLSPHQLRHATEQAHALGLVRARQGLSLTESGTQLAEVYDEAARWARAHDYPGVTNTFVTRVRATLQLLGSADVSVRRQERNGELGLVVSLEAAESLTVPKTAVESWIARHGGADLTATEAFEGARQAA